MPRVLTVGRRISARLERFGPDTGANVSIIFGLCAIVLVGMVGLGVDYGMAISTKAKLDNAADTAAVAAVATAKAYVAANPKQKNVTAKAIAAGITQATNTFNVNMGNAAFAQVQLQTPILTRTKQTFSSSVSYTATVQNHFGGIFGRPTVNLSDTATATGDVPSYLDFYLLIDVSGSMGLPSTSGGAAQLAANNQDMYSDYQQGCQFACHFPGYTAYNYAVTNQIQLRSDAVNKAVCSLLQRAATPAVPNQYRIGFYPFINQMATLAAITSDTSSLSSVAQCGSSWPLAFTRLLDTGTTQLSTGGDPTTGTGSGGTHFEVVLPQMQATISPYGDGSTGALSKPFVFLITDGMENGQHYFTWSNGNYAYPGNPSVFPGYASAWWDGSQPSQIDPANCAALKNAGATISILYIPYNIIQFTPNNGNIAWENSQVNSFSPTLSTPLRACASPGFFYTANTPADITNSLNAMFNQALQVTHLTQ